MEIYPIVMAKMLFVSFLFSLQAGALFDFFRALRLIFSGEPKSKLWKRAYRARLPISRKELFAKDEGKYNRFMKNAVIFFSDVFLFVYSAWGLMKINYSYNDGGVRGFTLVGMLVGFVLYYFCISRAVVFLLEGFAFFAKYAFKSLFELVSLPFYKIYNNFVKKIKKMLGKFHLRIEKRGEKVYNVNEVVCENRDFESRATGIRVSSSKRKRKGHGENEEK